jgi:biopolymer transport protein ExbD
MNLFVVMIPFMLLSVAFFQLGVIPATLPTHTENTSDVEADTRSVTVSLVINGEGLQVTAMSQSIPEAELNRLAKTLPKREGSYDREALQSWLQSIKQRYGASDTIVLLPAERVGYGELVGIMDAVRYLPGGEGEDEARHPLFPNIVMSRVRES